MNSDGYFLLMVQKSGKHNQCRLVVYPIYKVLAPSRVVGLGISEPSTALSAAYLKKHRPKVIRKNTDDLMVRISSVRGLCTILGCFQQHLSWENHPLT